MKQICDKNITDFTAANPVDNENNFVLCSVCVRKIFVETCVVSF